MGDDIAAEEFEAWYTPSEALTLLSPSMGQAAAVATLSRRVGAGVIQLVAATYVASTNGRETDRGTRLIVPPELWETPRAMLATTFWASGDLTMIADNMPTGYFKRGHVTKYFGSRFQPDGVRALMPRDIVRLADGGTSAQVPSKATETDDPKPPVSRADLKRWADVFLAVHADKVTEALAVQSAKAMFPNHAVSRDKVRELLPSRRPGRPASRGETRE